MYDEAFVAIESAWAFWARPEASELLTVTEEHIRMGLKDEDRWRLERRGSLNTAYAARTFRRYVRLAAPYFLSAQLSEALVPAAKGWPSTALDLGRMPCRDGFLFFEGGAPDWLGNEPRAAGDRLWGVHWGASMVTERPLLVVVGYVGPGAGLLRACVPLMWEHGGSVPWYSRDGDYRDAAPVGNYLQTFWAFIEQRIFVASHAPASRGWRKRAEREGRVQPEVRVIHLRRTEAAKESADREGTAREWSCRWLVSGHWRRQWYGRDKAHAPRWIAPYVKGDASKPLKPPSRRVFAVVR